MLSKCAILSVASMLEIKAFPEALICIYANVPKYIIFSSTTFL